MRDIPDDRFDAPRRAESIDTPSLLVVPRVSMGKLWVMAIGMVLFFVAMAAISVGNSVWFCLAMATYFGLMAAQMLATNCREVCLDTDRGRVVVRYLNPLFARFDVAFPMDRFGAVRTRLTKCKNGHAHFDLELVTRDGKEALVLTSGDANPWKYGMSDAELEPEAVAEVRRTIARRLVICDEGCVGFDRFLMTLARKKGERP